MIVKKKIPVILDTDIGTDIDDTWALAMLLNCPELDVKLIVTATGDTAYRAKVCAKLLQRAGRTDIPIAIGLRFTGGECIRQQLPWVEDYELSQYPGVVYADGIEATINTIIASPEPITLVSIGPLSNIAEVIKRKPQIACKTNFVGMHGSIYKEHYGKPGAIAEYNVTEDIAACQRVFEASWKNIIVTPLDTCGLVQLKEKHLARLLAANSDLLNDVFDNYRIWNKAVGDQFDIEKTTSLLYDTVAVHLAYSSEYIKMEKLPIRVTDEGYTVVDDAGQMINIAIDWLDFDGFCNELTERLLGKRSSEAVSLQPVELQESQV